MATTLKVLTWLVRLDGLVLVILGIAFWTGNALGMIPLHMVLGGLLVLALWLLAIVAAILRAPIGNVVVALVWGALVLWIGLTQQTMLPGSNHWIVQVVHLILGLGAIGIAQAFATSPSNAQHAG